MRNENDNLERSKLRRLPAFQASNVACCAWWTISVHCWKKVGDWLPVASISERLAAIAAFCNSKAAFILASTLVVQI